MKNFRLISLFLVVVSCSFALAKEYDPVPELEELTRHALGLQSVFDNSHASLNFQVVRALGAAEKSPSQTNVDEAKQEIKNRLAILRAQHRQHLRKAFCQKENIGRLCSTAHKVIWCSLQDKTKLFESEDSGYRDPRNLYTTEHIRRLSNEESFLKCSRELDHMESIRGQLSHLESDTTLCEKLKKGVQKVSDQMAHYTKIIELTRQLSAMEQRAQRAEEQVAREKEISNALLKIKS